MFIHVMYKDAPELSVLRRNSSEVDMAVEKTLLVNPDCPVRIMLEYIRKNCNLGIFTTFDLCDDRGSLKGLFNLPTYAYATDLVEHKRIYYVIVLRQESEKRLSILPQLNHDNKLYLELKDRVRNFVTGDFSPGTTTSAVLTPVPQPGKAPIRKK